MHELEKLELGAQPMGTAPISAQPTRMEELQQQPDYLLTKGFIRPSTSPYAALKPFTPKKDRGFRMCIDYRALNRITIKSRYPIPRDDELRGAKFFLKIDLRGGYHQIRVAAEDCHKTAFCLQPVAYELRKLQGAEKMYTVHNKEMLAIVHVFKTWQCYLTGADVTVQTDHKSLQYLRAQPNLNMQQIRRLDFLEKISTTPSHTNGVSTTLDNPTSEHFGVDKTMKMLQRNYYLPNMADDVCKYVSSYTACEIMKSSHQRAAGLLQPLDPPERPWQHVTMDYVTGLQTGPSGNDAILVVVDRLTKMAHFIACQQKITAEQTAQLFIANIIRLHGIPTAIISY
ncbi:hypothetical protein CLOM_g23581 [Closterium sp. NIES-68]|nr:hypothetical protein CLOM_g23581 [Closterium sp. NIES-68]